jgi:hypothetical protein
MLEVSVYESEESQESREIHITQEQREAALEYLSKSGDSSTNEDTRLADAEEVAMAERILALSLRSSDSARDAMYDFSESNYIPDVEMRKSLFAEAGIPESVEIRRHDVSLDRGGKIPPLKIIDLMKHEVDDEKRSSWKPVENGILFMGKITFPDHLRGNALYVPLDEEERVLVDRYLSRKESESQK